MLPTSVFVYETNGLADISICPAHILFTGCGTRQCLLGYREFRLDGTGSLEGLVRRCENIMLAS